MIIAKKDYKELFFIACWSALFVLVLVFRWQVLEQFAFKYTDSDQAIMWNAAVEFSHGFFHEPKFWGQDYNSMLEGLLAVPLILMSIPTYKALPIITSLLTLFPFFLVSILCLVKKLNPQAVLVLTIPLLLPLEYDFLTCLSRGFVTGIFVSSLGWIAVFYKEKSWGAFCFGFFTVFGYLLNPNALLLSFPLFIYLFLENKKQKSFYVFLSGGVLLGSILLILSNNFYKTHPNYSTMPVPSFKFRPELFSYFFQDPNSFLNTVTPLFWTAGISLFLIIALFAVVIYKSKNATLAFAIGLFLLCLFASFGLEKVYNGTNSIFFSSARMFLVVPVAIGFFVPFLNFKSKLLPPVFLSVAIIFFVNKNNLLPAAIESHIDGKREHIITVAPIQNVIGVCQKINYYSQKYATDLVVVSGHGYYDFIDFGCTTCVDSFPKTLRPGFERRTWRLLEDKDLVYPNILIVDEHQEIVSNLNKLKEKNIRFLNIHGYYIISNNSLKTMALLALLEIPVREF